MLGMMVVYIEHRDGSTRLDAISNTTNDLCKVQTLNVLTNLKGSYTRRRLLPNLYLYLNGDHSCK